MSAEGPGEILISEPTVSKLSVEVEVRLYNFDTGIQALKDEHKEFLKRSVIPAATANREARIRLLGSASKLGEPDPNRELSRGRATEVYNHLTKLHDVRPNQVVEFKALGEDFSTSPLINDPRDRAVAILLKFPIALEDVFLRTDDWSRELQWNDIIKLGGSDRKLINNLNIQITASGAPRSWSVKGRTVNLMPAKYPFEALAMKGRMGNKRHISRPIPLAEPKAQPSDPLKTIYRSSDSPEGWGFWREDAKPKVATVVRNGSYANLGLEDSGRWVGSGAAQQGYSRADEVPDALRLFQSGGVEQLFLMAVDASKWVVTVLLRSPANVFYYAGNANRAGQLTIGDSPWVGPAMLREFWKMPFETNVLIAAAPFALKVTFANNLAVSGPGLEWAKLLRSKNQGGPLTAILGYEGDAPEDRSVERDIAAAMGEKITAGLKDDQWVQAWLEVNGEHDGKNTWNAVGMDSRGYWWIERRDRVRQSWWKGPWYTIKGPAAIL